VWPNCELRIVLSVSCCRLTYKSLLCVSVLACSKVCPRPYVLATRCTDAAESDKTDRAEHQLSFNCHRIISAGWLFSLTLLYCRWRSLRLVSYIARNKFIAGGDL